MRVPGPHNVLPSEAPPFPYVPCGVRGGLPHQGAIRAEGCSMAGAIDGTSRRLWTGPDHIRTDPTDDRTGRDHRAEQARRPGRPDLGGPLGRVPAGGPEAVPVAIAIAV